MNKQKRVALVTGASSGIGNATLRKLMAAGYTVYGTSRSGIRTSDSPYSMLAMDVTDDTSVQRAVSELLHHEKRIDLLVNNAGVGVTGAAEESSIEQVQMLFDINVHGVIRVTNAVLPAMRAQQAGRILNIGSALGFIPAPFSAYYSATKHALEGYSEALDHEVRGLGIRVTLIEPGATQTSFEANTIKADRPLQTYDDMRQRYFRAYEKAMKEADSPESVAETIILAAQDRNPKLRYPSGKSAKQGAFARRFIPRSFFDKVLHTQFGLD